MNNLVKKLTKGNHPIYAGRPEDDAKALKRRVEMGYVFIRYLDTQGETELGFTLDHERSDLSNGDFSKAMGKVHLEGTLTLDYTKVRCIADVDLETMKGTSHLEALEEVLA